MLNKFAPVACVCALGAALMLPLNAQNTSRPPDDSAVNKQDRNASAPTADRAKNNMSDRDMMKNIRHDVVNDKSLSTYGHNVKIIASHGKVTLRGPVHSDEEKRAIEEHARKYAGDGNVDNQLSVKGDHER
jgi:hyperosmotically inducible periplasmic protein